MSSKQQHRLIMGAPPPNPGYATGSPNTDSAFITAEGGLCVEVNKFLWYPHEGTFQRLAIGAVSARSTILTSEEVYWIWATAPCHLRLGPSTVNATQSDFPFPANVVMEVTPYTGGFAPASREYLAVLQLIGSALTGYLYIGKARR